MLDLSCAPGARALRLLTLSSALVLAACGGGGSDTVPVTQQPDPVVVAPPEQKRVTITADNQLEVAAQAGASMSGIGPVAIFFGQILIPQPPVMNLQGSATPRVAGPVGSPAAALAESLRKFVPPKAPSNLLSAAAPSESETYNVECSSGTGTVTWTYTETENSYIRKASANLQNCQTQLQESTALIDGKLDFTMAETYDPQTDTGTQTADILAVKYTVKVEGFEVGMDGDLHMAFDDGSYISSGARFSLTGLAAVMGEEEEAPAQAQTVTMIDFHQEIKHVETGYEITSRAVIETNQFGELAIYEVATTQTLKYDFESGNVLSGQYKIVGAGNTTLTITADGEGTFKLERDEKGDGSVEATVTGLSDEDLGLNLFFIF